MSAFSALADFDGDQDDIVEQRKQQREAEAEARRAQEAKAQAKFAQLKAKAGTTSWGDSDDDDMFKSPVVSRRPALASAHVLTSPHWERSASACRPGYP